MASVSTPGAVTGVVVTMAMYYIHLELTVSVSDPFKFSLLTYFTNLIENNTTNG